MAKAKDTNEQATSEETQAEPQVEEQGEVVVDQDAKAPVLGEEEQSHEDRLDQARAEGLRNAAIDRDAVNK